MFLPISVDLNLYKISKTKIKWMKNIQTNGTNTWKAGKKYFFFVCVIIFRIKYIHNLTVKNKVHKRLGLFLTKPVKPKNGQVSVWTILEKEAFHTHVQN